MRSKRVLYFIDALILVFLAGAVLIEITGGFYGEPFGFRISARRPDRPFFVALVIGFIRWRWLSSGDFLGRPLAGYRRWYDVAADEMPGGASSRWHTAAVFLGLTAVAAFMLQEQLRQMTWVPDIGDPVFSMWRMGWVFHQLQGDPRGLFDANIFYPTPLTFTLSDSMLLPSLIAAPFLAAGFHPLLIYNGLLLAAFPLNGFATYLLVRRLTGSVAASFAGALYYMSHPYRLEHYPHFELQLTMWMPLLLLAVLHFAETRRIRYALAAAVLAAAQLYSSMYYGVYFPFYVLVIVVVLGVLKRWEWRRLAPASVLAGAVALVLAAPLAGPYLAAQAIKGDRDTAAVDYYSADLIDYLRPAPRLAAHGGRWLEASREERALFPGVTPLALSALALTPPVGPVRAAFAAALVVSFDMSRGLKGIVYPTLYRFFPPLRGMRVPARFSIILGISLAVLAAFGVRRLLARWPPGRARKLAFAGTMALMVLDLRPSLGLQPMWTDIPRIYQELDGRSDVVLAEFPFEQKLERVTNELPFMYFSLWHWHQMINGYSGFIPDGHESLVKLMKDFPDPASIAALRARGVTHITVNCELIRDPCREFMDRVDERPEFKLIRVAHWNKRPTRLYEFH